MLEQSKFIGGNQNDNSFVKSIGLSNKKEDKLITEESIKFTTNINGDYKKDAYYQKTPIKYNSS